MTPRAALGFVSPGGNGASPPSTGTGGGSGMDFYAALEGERKQVTVLFADLKSSIEVPNVSGGEARVKRRHASCTIILWC